MTITPRAPRDFQSWDALIVSNPMLPISREGMKYTVMMTMAATAVSQLDFSRLTPEGSHPHYLAAALRSCCACRANIATWNAGLLIAIDACALQGIDARKLLTGLL